MLKQHIIRFASLILSLRSRAELTTRRVCVVRLCEFAERGGDIKGFSEVLDDCAKVASDRGDWYLAALLRRAREEVLNSFKPLPGHNLRRIFRRKRKQYA